MWRKSTSVTVGFLIVVGSAWAQGVIHVVPPQPFYYGPVVNSQNLDLNGDGLADFLLNSDDTAVTLAPQGNNRVIAIPEPPPDLGYLAAALNSGTTISSSLDPVYAWYGRTTDQFGSAGIVACVNIGCIGYFQGATDAYAGLELEFGGSVYYGWLRIQNLGMNIGQVSEWAYESSPNTPIFAGVVPEPSTWTLLLLGGGVLALRNLRRS